MPEEPNFGGRVIGDGRSEPTPAEPASAGTPGMGSSSGVQVPRGGDDPNHKSEATAPSRGGVGRKPEAKSRPEEHEPHTRRGGPGELARHGEARGHQGPSRRCGGCAMKVAALIRGGLHGCPSGTAGVARPLPAVEKSAEAVVPVRDREGGREGPNAKPRRRTPVLAEAAMSAANPSWGLGGRVGR